MKKLFLLAVMILTFTACEERGDDFINSQTNDKQKNTGTASKEEPDGQDPAIIVPPRR